MASRILATLLVLGGFIFSASAEGPKLDLGKYSQRVSVSHYTSKDFNAIERLLYEDRDDQFVPGNGFKAEDPSHCVGGYLRSQQNFPLLVQMMRSGLTLEEAEREVDIGHSLNHQQIAFFESTRMIPREDWNGDVNANVIDMITPAELNEPGSYPVKEGGFWTVAGQILQDTSDASYVAADLPWQKGEGAKEVSDKYFSRGNDTPEQKAKRSPDAKTYQFVSEWGRAGQIGNEFGPLYAAAAGMDYRRITAMGGKLEDAWVMFSTSNPKNIRLYDKAYPDSRFPPGVDTKKLGMKETAFIVPLAKMLEKYPPSKYFERVAKIKELAGGALSETQALDLLTDLKTLTWDELSLKTAVGSQKQRLILADFSSAAYWALPKTFERFGIPHEKWAGLEKYLAEYETPVQLSKEDEFSDFSHPDHHEALTHLNAVEISNLHPSLAAADPNLVRTALLGAYAFHMKKYFRQDTKPSIEELHQFILDLDKSNVHFAITSASPDVNRQALLLHPQQIIPARVVHGGRSTLGFTYIFSVRQIHAIMDSDRDFYNRYCDFSVGPGTPRAKYLLNSNDPF